MRILFLRSEAPRFWNKKPVAWCQKKEYNRAKDRPKGKTDCKGMERVIVVTLTEAAKELNIDLEGTLGRFSGNEGLYLRFLRRLPQDKTFEQLAQGVEQGDAQIMEQAAHTLKGVAANLGLEDLRQASDGVVQAVRAGQTGEACGQFERVRQAFQRACDVLGGLE